jgi:predicted MPP superfamily phosphohydrolase
MFERLLSGFIVLVIADYCIYLLIKRLKHHSPGSNYPFAFRILQNLSIIGLIVFSVTWTILHPTIENDPESYRSHFVLTAVFAIIYIPKLILVFAFWCGELLILLKRLKYRLFNRHKSISSLVKFHIRRTFALAGLFLSLVIVFFILKGIYVTRSDFQVREVHVFSADLPAVFDGFRVVQLSDMHLGSWTNPKDVEKGLLMAQQAKPDLICLTGDLINVNSAETEPYIKAFTALNAPYGKLAILGNHDMGDYARYGSRDSSGNDIHRISLFYEQTRFQLLRNRHIILKKETDSLAVIGIDNWGKKKFRQYGKLDKAMNGCDSTGFSILLSHDPTHWRAEVENKKDIDLTLSGHTHGMQMALEIKDYRFSPAYFIYKQWAGLFTTNTQQLYVNPGFGFLGFPGRIGLRPEITLLILHRKK